MKHIAGVVRSALILMAMLSGCALNQARPSFPQTESAQADQEEDMSLFTSEITEAPSSTPEAAEAVLSTTETAKLPPPSTILRPDWASYFGQLNGAAVIFDPVDNTLQVYNENLANTRRSPCSTFKIISSLVGLQQGVIEPEDSIRAWSGETFWNEDWNKDMDFYSAFRTSCVWYYRQVIDDIGPEVMEEALEELSYGNGDLSDWAGQLNTNNHNPALTGFWIESSLNISPREQVRVLETIFGDNSRYSPEIREELEKVMFLPGASKETCAIYGKTGMGKANGIVVDAWYAGFADLDRRIYFCIYLGETADQNVSSGLAREIAVSLLDDLDSTLVGCPTVGKNNFTTAIIDFNT